MRVFVGLSMAVCEAKVLRQSVTRWTVGFYLAVLGCQKVKWVGRGVVAAIGASECPPPSWTA